MKILLTGASSYVGARLYFDLEDKYELIGTYFKNQLSSKFLQLDLTDKNATQKLIKNLKPSIITHVANYPSARDAIDNGGNYLSLNKKSTEYLTGAANEIDAKVIFISSLAAKYPDNIYGRLKSESEELVKTTKAGYLILRPSFILGFSPNTTNDRPFNRIIKCLDDKTKPAIFDTSWKLQPTYVGHLSQIIERVIEQNLWNKTVPVYINEVVTQYQIAKDVLSNFGITVQPIDKKINIPPSKDDLSLFNSFSLKPKTYKKLIEVLINEINNRIRYII